MLKNWKSFNENSETNGMSLDTDTKKLLTRYIISIEEYLHNLFSDKSREIKKEINNAIEDTIVVNMSGINFGLYNKKSQVLDTEYDFDIKKSINTIFDGMTNGYIVPGFKNVINIEVDKINADVSEKKNSDVYNRIIRNIISNVYGEEFTVKSSHKITSDYNTLKMIVELETYISDFKIDDISNDSGKLKAIYKYPEFVDDIYGTMNDKKLFKYIYKSDKRDIIINSMNKDLKLKYVRYSKSIDDPERSKMEENSQMYVFIGRPKFVEDGHGRYIKDLEIENLYPIDPYDRKYANDLQFMKVRAHAQQDHSEVYCIWLDKEMDFSDIDINDDEHKWLRDAIASKMQKL